MSQLSLHPIARKAARVPDTVAAIKHWTRNALGLGSEAVVSVTELACSAPGCAPEETVVLVLQADEPTRKLSLHKPMRDVTEQDVAIGWSQASSAQMRP